MFTRFSFNIQGILFGLLGFALYSVADVTAKYLTQSYPVLQIVAVESLLTVLICLIAAKRLGGLRPTFKTRKLKLHIVRGVCNSIITVLAITAFAKLPMTLVYTLIFISPFLTALMAMVIYKEKVDWHGWIAIAAGFTGVLVVLRPGLSAFDPWLFLPLTAAFFVAAGFLLARALGQNETIVSLAIFPAGTSALALMPIALVLYEWPALEDLWLFLLGSLAFMGGLIFLALAFQRGKSSIVAPTQYSQILWGASFGFLFFNDIPDLWTLIGATIIIGSGLYLFETERSLTKINAAE